LTPQAQAAGLGDQATAASAFLSLLYTGKIARFKRRTDADVRVLNAFGLLTRYVKRPARYGFTNPTDPCVSFLPPCTSFADPDEYVFWDGIHPTTRTHKLVSDAAARILRRRRR
jgi:phospholipase/lecithinase/hemolysin